MTPHASVSARHQRAVSSASSLVIFAVRAKSAMAVRSASGGGRTLEMGADIGRGSRGDAKPRRKADGLAALRLGVRKLSLREGHERPVFGAGVVGAGADDFAVDALLDDVRGPTGGAGHDEE